MAPPAPSQSPESAAQDELPSTVTLPDGKQIPIRMPPGVDSEQAKLVVDYLQNNPKAAEQSYMEAQRMLGQPGMMAAMQAQEAAQRDPAYQAQLAQLREDPDLKHVFEDIQTTGGAAMERYWNDTELMERVAAKMQGVSLGSKAVSKQLPANSKAVPPSGGTLHDAAKAGDVSATQELLQQGADVNKQDPRGATALHLAVGYNRLEVVKALLAAGADLRLTDARGNTVLHYAAGYGRRDAAELLLAKGARLDVRNQQGQSPADAAKVNRELTMVKLLESKSGRGGKPRKTQGSKYI